MANIREAYNHIIISLSVQACVFSRCTFDTRTYVRMQAWRTQAYARTYACLDDII